MALPRVCHTQPHLSHLLIYWAVVTQWFDTLSCHGAPESLPHPTTPFPLAYLFGSGHTTVLYFVRTWRFWESATPNHTFPTCFAIGQWPYISLILCPEILSPFFLHFYYCMKDCHYVKLRIVFNQWIKRLIAVHKIIVFQHFLRIWRWWFFGHYFFLWIWVLWYKSLHLSRKVCW